MHECGSVEFDPQSRRRFIGVKIWWSKWSVIVSLACIIDCRCIRCIEVRQLLSAIFCKSRGMCECLKSGNLHEIILRYTYLLSEVTSLGRQLSLHSKCRLSYLTCRMQ
jgi:hypothetical protein